MRYAIFLAFCLLASLATADDWEEHERYSDSADSETLRILSSTDTAVFLPVIEGFQKNNPGISIDYYVTGTADVYERFKRSPTQFDVVISSAMDLQLKLVNDGYASRQNDIVLPSWAHWRQSLFGFTLEPASIVINKAAFAELPPPESRQDIIQMLRARPTVFRHRTGTYDIRQSGLGYLFATQDARTSDTYWRLMEIMGSLNTRIYCCSGEMIDDVASGKILLAYNVLGSYAKARTDIADKIQILQPSDFPNVMMRTALASRHAHQPQLAALFLRYLTSSHWWQAEEGDALLPSIHSDIARAPGTPIALDPGLLVFLDRLKRERFVSEWESAVIQ